MGKLGDPLNEKTFQTQRAQTKNMTWITEWPTTPGLYFCYGGYKQSNSFRLMICKVRTAGPKDKPFPIWVSDGQFIYKSEVNVVFWSEPIQEPTGGNEVFAHLFAKDCMTKIFEDSKKPWADDKIETPFRLSSETAKLFQLNADNPPIWLLKMAVEMFEEGGN